jgi:hypothetical protein
MFIFEFVILLENVMANERKKVIAYVTNEASCIKSSNLIKKTHQQTFQYQIAFQMIMNMF